METTYHSHSERKQRQQQKAWAQRRQGLISRILWPMQQYSNNKNLKHENLVNLPLILRHYCDLNPDIKATLWGHLRACSLFSLLANIPLRVFLIFISCYLFCLFTVMDSVKGPSVFNEIPRDTCVIDAGPYMNFNLWQEILPQKLKQAKNTWSRKIT